MPAAAGDCGQSPIGRTDASSAARLACAALTKLQRNPCGSSRAAMTCGSPCNSSRGTIHVWRCSAASRHVSTTPQSHPAAVFAFAENAELLAHPEGFGIVLGRIGEVEAGRGHAEPCRQLDRRAVIRFVGVSDFAALSIRWNAPSMMRCR